MECSDEAKTLIRAYRIVKTRRVATAFDGEGAFLYGGRWNSEKTRLVYLASSVALALLETLVHLDDANLRASYSIVPLSFPASCVATPGKNGCPALPNDWAQMPAPLAAARWGDAWVAQNKALLVRVPSVIVPQESNFLLNTAHPDWDKASIRKAQPLSLDARFIEKIAAQTALEPPDL